MNKINVGVVIADEWEFVPLKKWAEKFETQETVLRQNEAVIFDYSDRVHVTAVKCGIGKVNAAMATAFLISENNCDIILNIGLSGAVEDVHKGDIVAGTEYIECDFDLTAIGREPGVKPDQEYLYKCDDKLLSLAKKCRIDKFCRLGTGDIFLADKQLKEKYRTLFEIKSFDMETAAIAGVCHKAEIPSISIRKISDDCDEGAAESYTELNNKAEIHLSEILDELLCEITENY